MSVKERVCSLHPILPLQPAAHHTSPMSRLPLLPSLMGGNRANCQVQGPPCRRWAKVSALGGMREVL